MRSFYKKNTGYEIMMQRSNFSFSMRHFTYHIYHISLERSALEEVYIDIVYLQTIKETFSETLEYRTDNLITGECEVIEMEHNRRHKDQRATDYH